MKPKLGFVMVHVDHATDDHEVTVGEEEIRRAGWSEPAPVIRARPTSSSKRTAAHPCDKP